MHSSDDLIREDSSTLLLLKEDAEIEIHKRVTGVVRLEKSVLEQDQIVSADLVRETVSIERVSVDRYIDEPVLVRQEGDVTIFPVMEEIVITRKQLVLKEEIRVKRHRTQTHYQESVPVRAEDLKVVRLTPDQAERVAEPAPL